MKRLFVLLIILGFYQTSAWAQSAKNLRPPTISLEETIKFINSKLEPKIHVDLKDGDLIAKYYNDHNKLFRIDKADTEVLDWKNITFNEEDKLIVIPCFEKDGKCVERTMVIRKEGDLYVRTSFKIEDPALYNCLKKAFTHLIRTIEEVDYGSMEPFE